MGLPTEAVESLSRLESNIVIPAPGDGPLNASGGVSNSRTKLLDTIAKGSFALVYEIDALKDVWDGSPPAAGKTALTISSLDAAILAAYEVTDGFRDMSRGLVDMSRSIVASLVDLRASWVPPSHELLVNSHEIRIELISDAEDFRFPGDGDLHVVTVTGATTLTAGHDVVLCNATSAAFTVTLPAAASNTGRRYSIKKIDSSANAVTVDGNGSETVDDSTTRVLSMQYDSISIVSDGTEWWII